MPENTVGEIRLYFFAYFHCGFTLIDDSEGVVRKITAAEDPL